MRGCGCGLWYWSTGVKKVHFHMFTCSHIVKNYPSPHSFGVSVLKNHLLETPGSREGRIQIILDICAHSWNSWTLPIIMSIHHHSGSKDECMMMEEKCSGRVPTCEAYAYRHTSHPPSLSQWVTSGLREEKMWVLSIRRNVLLITILSLPLLMVFKCRGDRIVSSNISLSFLSLTLVINPPRFLSL